MPQKVKIKAILKKAYQIKAAWEGNPEFGAGEIQLSKFTATLEAAEKLAHEYSIRRLELSGLKDKRDTTVQELDRIVTRYRSGIYAHYGPDSVQYAKAGVTRRSERKRRRRKSKTAFQKIDGQ